MSDDPNPAHYFTLPCAICGVKIHAKQAHIAGTWCDGRIAWGQSCGHKPFYRAHIRLGGLNCAAKYMAQNMTHAIAIAFVINTGHTI